MRPLLIHLNLRSLLNRSLAQIPSISSENVTILQKNPGDFG